MTDPPFHLDTPLLRTAKSLVEKLRQGGFMGYFVGGGVRDLVMGNTPKDVDIATDATPDQIEALFPNTIGVGALFGVMLVIVDNVRYEVATFRSESSYRDGRHPEVVDFASTPDEDARRRDFTLNALYYDPVEMELLDFFGGQRDIEQRIIRAIGVPGERFNEDKLRLMRAVRFAVRFGFEIEAKTKQAICEWAHKINQVSAERLRDELSRILTEGHSEAGFLLLDELGLLQPILPELLAMKGVDQPPEFHPEGDVWTHTMLLLRGMDERRREVREAGIRNQVSGVGGPGPVPEAKRRGGQGSGVRDQTGRIGMTSDTRHPAPDTYPSPVLAWAVLLHDIGKPGTFERAPDRIRFNGHMELGAKMVRTIGRRLRFSNEMIEAVAELVLDHLKFKDVRKMKLSTLKRFVRRLHFAEHLELHRLDCLASHGDLDAYQFTREFAESLEPEQARPPRLLNGHDLIELGYTPGPEFKKILAALEDAQLENQIADREAALDFVAQRFPSRS
ncbi:MAG: CCA tRNA nucleotidyltransferase [Acidobacteriia bacterium]|nr:CCA tRNA nucleotidyltransferase [Terriglobia bacterium]